MPWKRFAETRHPHTKIRGFARQWTEQGGLQIIVDLWYYQMLAVEFWSDAIPNSLNKLLQLQ